MLAARIERLFVWLQRPDYSTERKFILFGKQVCHGNFVGNMLEPETILFFELRHYFFIWDFSLCMESDCKKWHISLQSCNNHWRRKCHVSEGYNFHILSPEIIFYSDGSCSKRMLLMELLDDCNPFNWLIPPSKTDSSAKNNIMGQQFVVQRHSGC